MKPLSVSGEGSWIAGLEITILLGTVARSITSAATGIIIIRYRIIERTRIYSLCTKMSIDVGLLQTSEMTAFPRAFKRAVGGGQLLQARGRKSSVQCCS